MTPILPPGGLYALLDTQWVAQGDEGRSAAAAAKGGAALLQYRDKLNRGATAAAAVVENARSGGGCPVLVNDDVTLAQTVGAAGVHLGQSDTGLRQARRQLGRDAIIGITCHGSLDLAAQALAAGADYVSFGRFFSSRTKPGAPGVAISLLARARAQLAGPIVAIGGINLDNGGQLIEAGADYLAVAGAIFGQKDIQAACTDFSRLFSSPPE